MRHLIGNTGFGTSAHHSTYILPGALKPASSRLPVWVGSFKELPVAWATDLREEKGHDLSMEIAWFDADKEIAADLVYYYFYASDIAMFRSRRGRETIRVITDGTIRGIFVTAKQVFPLPINPNRTED